MSSLVVGVVCSLVLYAAKTTDLSFLWLSILFPLGLFFSVQSFDCSISLTPVRVICRFALGRTERVAYSDIKRMWGTRLNITPLLGRYPVVVDAVAIQTIHGQIFVWPLNFSNKEDLRAKLTQATHLKIEPLKRNDLGHSAFGN